MNLHITKQDIEVAKWQKWVDLGSLAVSFGLFFYIFRAIDSLPKLVPTHFNIRGVPDQFGSPATLFVLPATLLFVQLMTALSRIDPRFMNVPVKVHEGNAKPIFTLASKMMSGVQALVTLLFLILTLQTVAVAQLEQKALLLFPVFTCIALKLALVFFSIFRMKKLAKSLPPAKVEVRDEPVS